MARLSGCQHADDAGTVMAAVNVIAQENDNRRTGQARVVNRPLLQKSNHVRQEIGAAVNVADGIANPSVKKSRDG